MKRRVILRLDRAQASLMEIENKIAKTRAQREAAIVALLRAEQKISEFDTVRRRLKKRIDKLRALRLDEAHEAAAKLPDAFPNAVAGDLDIPDFLARDRQAKADIEAELKATKKQKTNARIAKLRATLSGETKRMPASGKDALRLINER